MNTDLGRDILNTLKKALMQRSKILKDSLNYLCSSRCQVLTSQSKSGSVFNVCGERPRQTLHSILAHAYANNTHHMLYCLKECPLLQDRNRFVLLTRTGDIESELEIQNLTIKNQVASKPMLDQETIGYRSLGLCDRDIQGDICTHK